MILQYIYTYVYIYVHTYIYIYIRIYIYLNGTHTHTFFAFLLHRVVNAQVDDTGLFRSEEPHHNVGRIEAQARIAEEASKLITFFDLCGHERRVGQTVFFFKIDRFANWLIASE